MEVKVSISYFKAHCLQIIEELKTNKHSIIITKRNHPIAKVEPVDKTKVSLFGILEDRAHINGDIVSSIDLNWDANE